MIKYRFLYTSLFISFGVGNTLFLIGRMYRSKLTDFELGFIEGLAIVFLLMGTTYLFLCAVKKKNPLTYL